ncbi:MAG TPA: carbohydrate ABC transporter permease [Candidatus Eisenbergiella merdipullorum]|uniref:Carbohydrate ABC transporter permease n=1 Tax=Candidatus Eisenbergiella merdipullorum TaxID=2838553 RepID=A0A9D2I2I0_9FIRM|nr:carbohydrate ABC transporter permease [Candidatus Eisenbergiella merdipullorum]
MKKNSDRPFYFLNGLLLILFTIICGYPILCIISQAISDPLQVGLGLVTFYPRGFSLKGFQYVLKDRWLIHGFLMSILYTVTGTVINVMLTYITAFSLSRRELPGRGFLQLFFAFTMWFSGGMIPEYLLVKNMGLIDNFWALILPGAMSVWNMIVCRTFLQNSIPEELFDAAKVDGAGYVRYMLEITVPLSKAIIAVLVLWYAIGHWNSYFNALIYITDKSLRPFSLYLRDYLVMQSTMDIADLTAGESVRKDLQGITELMKNSLILLSCLPLWILYPFIRKYLVQGVMIGSVKG